MMIVSQPFGFSVVRLLCFFVGVLALENGGYYQCSTWKLGEKVTVTFFINRTSLSSECVTASGKPFFSMSLNSTAGYDVNCTGSDDIRTPGNCNFPSGSLGCGCIAENDNGYYVAQYNFIATPDYGMWWEANTNCRDSNFNEALSFTPNPGCQPILHATTTPATTVLPPDDGLDAGQIAGIVVGCVVILVIIIIIIVFILKKKKGCVGMPFSAPTDSPQPVNGHNVSAAPTSTADKPPTNTGNGSDRRQ